MISGNSSIEKIIDSNFSDLCVCASDLTASDKRSSNYYRWAKNPYDGWFSRVYDIAIPESHIVSEVAHIRAEIERGQAPKLLLLTEGRSGHGLPDVLRSNGFTMFYEQTGMAVDLSENVSPEFPECYDIRQITPFEFDAWNDVIEQVFGNRKNPELYHAFMQDERFAFFACFDHQRIVATALLFTHKDIAGIHLVATLKDARGKGVGSQITHAAFEYARANGAKIGVLQASPMGRTVYEKLGFKAFSRISHWEYVGCAGASIL